MANDLKPAASRFMIREAKKEDVSSMSDVFFHSFNAPFWQYFIPPTPEKRKWWDDSWLMGIENPTDRSFVVEDTERGNKIVAFSRWMIPQLDGNLERKWAAMAEDEWDMDIADCFFGAVLEMLGVHEDYQKHGIGGRLIRWGTRQADMDGLETYLDGSEVGQPYYKSRHAFGSEKDIDIPDRPEYGSFSYRSMIRLPQKPTAGA
ncbi:hypothetical protein LTR85_001768 [Meristemomyces frigidus]|nr:hypothetical protein LTR85_001768 [Meristemomyces frigidus]